MFCPSVHFQVIPAGSFHFCLLYHSLLAMLFVPHLSGHQTAAQARTALSNMRSVQNAAVPECRADWAQLHIA